MNEGLSIEAKAKVKLTKLDADGNVIGYEEREVKIGTEEAKRLWDLQQQD